MFNLNQKFEWIHVARRVSLFTALNPKKWACALVVLVLLGGSMVFTSTAAAQTPPDYEVVWLPMPDGTTYVAVEAIHVANFDGAEKIAFAVGTRSIGDGRTAFVYDHFGTITGDGLPAFYDIGDLVVAPPDLSWFRDINTAGRVVGYVQQADGPRLPCYLDLFETDSSGNRELITIDLALPDDTDARGWEVNENGDILITTTAANGYPYIFNPESSELIEIVVPTISTQVQFNDLRQVVGYGLDEISYRHSVATGVTEFFPDYFRGIWGPYKIDINNAGEFSQTLAVVNGRQRGYHAIRVDAAGVIAWDSGKDYRAGEINQSGDMLLIDRPAYYNTFWIHHRGLNETYFVKDLVLSEDPFQDAVIAELRFSDRDDTDFPWIAGRADTGDGSYDRGFLLVPGISGPGGNTVTWTAAEEIADWEPLDIPDYPQPGVSSTMHVTDNYVIDNLTVRLNIDHSRPSDLRASLTGPDGVTTVELPNISGDNPVDAFYDWSSVGDWTLNVWDTKQKKTGTLNGWSITVTVGD